MQTSSVLLKRVVQYVARIFATEGDLRNLKAQTDIGIAAFNYC